jgi:hypothetical protein
LRTPLLRRPPPVTLALVVLLGCASAPTPTGCDKYASERDVYQRCLANAVPASSTPEQVDLLCSATGDAEGMCRARWVEAHMRALPAERLLVACGSDPDCMFKVLDLNPTGTPTQQVAACAATGPLKDYCVSHALVRAFVRCTGTDALESIMGLPGVPYDRAAGVRGLVTACCSVDACATAPAREVEECLRTAHQITGDTEGCSALHPGESAPKGSH